VPTKTRRFAIAAPAELKVAPGSNGSVIRGIEGKEHAHVPLRVGAQHKEISVLRRLDVDPRAVAASEDVV